MGCKDDQSTLGNELPEGLIRVVIPKHQPGCVDPEVCGEAVVRRRCLDVGTSQLKPNERQLDMVRSTSLGVSECFRESELLVERERIGKVLRIECYLSVLNHTPYFRD